MGAWGYSYDQNDDYYNEGNFILEAALDKLHELMTNYRHGLYILGTKVSDDGPDWESISKIGRSYVITTVKALEGSTVSSYDGQKLDNLQDAANLVRESIEHCADDWSDPEEFRKVVNEEMDALNSSPP